jgi:hypothetical protein
VKTHRRPGLPDFFSVLPTYQNGENIPNNQQMYQIAINYSKCQWTDQIAIKYAHLFHCKTLYVKFTQIGIFVLKVYHLATLSPTLIDSRRNQPTNQPCKPILVLFVRKPFAYVCITLLRRLFAAKDVARVALQWCQIFIDTIYQNAGKMYQNIRKVTKCPFKNANLP